MKKLHFEVHINASPEKVYKTTIEDKTYREWTKAFNPSGPEGQNSWVEGDWSKGSKIKFIGSDENGNIGGMVAIIEDNRPNEFISIKHMGILDPDGKEDYESPEAKKWAPAFENYTFKNINGRTLFIVDFDTVDEYVEFFNKAWPEALGKLKEISERR